MFQRPALTRRQWLLAALPLILLAGGAAYFLMKSGTLHEGVRADKILVEKGARRLTLFRQGQVLRTYRVALGPNPEGHKQAEGDGRTPEGRYAIDWHNPQSKFHLSLHVNYPNADDQARAQANGVSPGGEIMVHGLPNSAGGIGSLHSLKDWTAGCVAVTNEEIEEIYRAVPDGAEIEIVP